MSAATDPEEATPTLEEGATPRTGTEIIAETLVLPEGLDPATDTFWRAFSVTVRWASTRGWIVTGGHPDERLTRTGRTWTWHVAPRNRHLYYFPTRQEALDAAHAAVTGRTVNGLTLQQWRHLPPYAPTTEGDPQ